MKLDESAPRPRQFAVYLWNSSLWQADFFPYMDVFTVDGGVADSSAWKTEEPIYAPNTPPEGRSRGFYRPERGVPGQTLRWSTPTGFLNPPPDARGVELKVRSASDKPQTLTSKCGADHRQGGLAMTSGTPELFDPPSKSTPAAVNG